MRMRLVMASMATSAAEFFLVMAVSLAALRRIKVARLDFLIAQARPDPAG